MVGETPEREAGHKKDLKSFGQHAHQRHTVKIESLSVSKPRSIVHEGRQIVTGIFKTPIQGLRMVRRTNIDGDGQADLSVHGGVHKAVYAFPYEHYDFYRERLGREPFDFGQFGENLTVSGLLESGVRIGDRYRVGDVVFEVSQPRSPCFKFGIKMGHSEAVRLCLSSAKTGFYFRVIEEGIIGAGMNIDIVSSDEMSPTVQEVHNTYYFDRKNVEGLTRAANCKALAPPFRDEFVSRLRKLKTQAL